LEINSQPKRLDINDAIIRKAVENKVPLLINTDAHSTKQLENIRLGILQARRGWCEKKNILNTLSYDKFMKKLK